MKKILLGFFALTAGLSATTFDYEANGALAVKATDPTRFVMGYCIWFSAAGAEYNWADSSKYNDAFNQTQRTLEAIALSNGVEPVTEGARLCATPALPQSIQTQTGLSAGYYSNNPAVIRYHNTMLLELGVDIIAPDLTNLTAQDFAGPEPEGGYTGYHPQNYYALMNTLGAISGQVVRVMPTTGVLNADDLVKRDGVFSPFQYSIIFFLKQFQLHPKLAVTYERTNSPIITTFFGVSGTYFEQAEIQVQELKSAGYVFTERYMTGYGESQPFAWHPAESNDWRWFDSQYRVPAGYLRLKSRYWTWCDRLYGRAMDGFTTYTLTPDESRCEFVAVSPRSPSVDSMQASTSFRGGMAINAQMTVAKRLNPVFVFLSEFNHFASHDSGYSLETTRDIEPTVEWGTAVYDAVKDSVSNYKKIASNTHRPRFTDVSARGFISKNGEPLVAGVTIKGNSGLRLTAKGMGPSLLPFFESGILCATDPALSATATNPSATFSNSSWGSFSPELATTSSVPRQVLNSAFLLNSMNYGVPLQANEPGLTIDATGNSSITFSLTEEGLSLGRGVGHIRVIPNDLISDTRMSEFSFLSKVSKLSDAGVLIAQFSVEKTITIGIVGVGPSLASLGVPGALADPIIDIVNSEGVILHTVSGSSNSVLAQVKNYHPWINSTAEPALVNFELDQGTYSVVLRNENEAGAPIGGLALLSVWEM